MFFWHTSDIDRSSHAWTPKLRYETHFKAHVSTVKSPGALGKQEYVMPDMLDLKVVNEHGEARSVQPIDFKGEYLDLQGIQHNGLHIKICNNFGLWRSPALLQESSSSVP